MVGTLVCLGKRSAVKGTVGDVKGDYTTKMARETSMPLNKRFN